MSYKLEWKPSPNFTPGSQTQAVYGRPRSIQFGAGHWWNLPELAGTHAGIVTMFQNPARQGSAHAVLSDGLVTEMVRAGDTAWTTSHANPFTYSIEVDPRIMWKWGWGNPIASQRAHGERIFQTLAEYIADKRYHNMTWHPHNFWISTQCNPIRWNEVMARAKQIRAAKDAPAPAPTPTPPASAKLTWSKLAKPLEMVATKQPTKLWNFNQTAWGGFGNGVKDFNKGDRITIYGKVVNKTLGATYLLTEYSYSNKITNGFNQADLEPYAPPAPPQPEWIKNMKDITPIKLMVLTAQTPIVDLNNLSIIKQLGQGTWVDFTRQTTVAGKVYLISQYSADHGMPNGILKSDVGIPAPVTEEPPVNEKPAWLENWEDIEDVVMYTRADTELIDLVTGETIKMIPKATAVEIASATTWLEKRYMLTKWATDNKHPHGIRLDDLDLKPVDESPVPLPEDPDRPVDELIRENNGLLQQILALLQKVWNIITGKVRRTIMSDFVISLIRTWTPVLVGSLLAWLAGKGLEIDPADAAGLITALTGIFIAAYYLLARLIEKWLPALGGLLLGSRKQPDYFDPDYFED